MATARWPSRTRTRAGAAIRPRLEIPAERRALAALLLESVLDLTAIPGDRAGNVALEAGLPELAQEMLTASFAHQIVIAGGGSWPPLSIDLFGGITGASIMPLVLIPAA